MENSNLENILKRAYLFLEDKDWEKAYEYAEKALDIDAELSDAYIVKLLVDNQAMSIDDLKNTDNIISENKNYKKALRFNNTDKTESLIKINDYITEKNINKEKQRIYERGLWYANQNDYETAIKYFKTIRDYKDSKNKIKEYYHRQANVLKFKENRREKTARILGISMIIIISSIILFALISILISLAAN